MLRSKAAECTERTKIKRQARYLKSFFDIPPVTRERDNSSPKNDDFAPVEESSCPTFRKVYLIIVRIAG